MSKKGRVSKIQLFFKNEMYALLYQLIIVPVLMYVVYQLFMKSLSFSNNGIMEVFYLVILIGVMIGTMYIISYIYNNLFKMPVEYYGITGAIFLGISGILNALFKMKYDVQCADDTVSTCANAITNMRLSTFILICVIIFYILFLLMHLITRKQKDAE